MTTTLQTTTPLPRERFEAYPREAHGLVTEATNGGLLIDAPYQRGAVWTTDQQRNLVRSFLMGLPIPSLVFNDRCTLVWEQANGERPALYAVIDGRQRIEAAIAWFGGTLDVPASWFEPELVAGTHETPDGPYVTQGDLTSEGQRFVRRQAKFPVAVAAVPTLAQEAAIFGLVNGAGTPQDAATLDAAAALAAGAAPA